MSCSRLYTELNEAMFNIKVTEKHQAFNVILDHFPKYQTISL